MLSFIHFPIWKTEEEKNCFIPEDWDIKHLFRLWCYLIFMKFRFGWYFSFNEDNILKKLALFHRIGRWKKYFCYSDIYFLAVMKCQFWVYSNFCDILVWMRFQLERCFSFVKLCSFSDMSVFWNFSFSCILVFVIS